MLNKNRYTKNFYLNVLNWSQMLTNFPISEVIMCWLFNHGTSMSDITLCATFTLWKFGHLNFCKQVETVNSTTKFHLYYLQLCPVLPTNLSNTTALPQLLPRQGKNLRANIQHFRISFWYFPFRMQALSK